MPRLLNRQKQIPNGFKFYQPQTKWSPPAFASFDTIVTGLIANRQANPQYNLPTDYNTVVEEVDAFNAEMCARMGWNSYITGASGPPLTAPRRSPIQSVKAVAAGGETLVEWIRSGAEAVPADLSQKRASICAACPKNGQGGLTSIFTVPVSEAIREAIGQRRQWGLSTPNDDSLGVCDACFCPLKLKVHMPIDQIMVKLPATSKELLVPECWILAESK